MCFSNFEIIHFLKFLSQSQMTEHSTEGKTFRAINQTKLNRDLNKLMFIS